MFATTIIYSEEFPDGIELGYTTQTTNNLDECVEVHKEEEFSWSESIEMADTEFGLSESIRPSSRPIIICPTRLSGNKSSGASRSPTETFLSAASPFQLPFIPTTRPSPMNHAKEAPHNHSGTQRTWPDTSRKGHNQLNRPSGMSSTLTSALQEQSAHERMACRRQMRKKERLVQNTLEGLTQERRSSQLYPVDCKKRVEPYNYAMITSW